MRQGEQVIALMRAWYRNGNGKRVGENVIEIIFNVEEPNE